MNMDHIKCITNHEAHNTNNTHHRQTPMVDCSTGALLLTIRRQNGIDELKGMMVLVVRNGSCVRPRTSRCPIRLRGCKCQLPILWRAQTSVRSHQPEAFMATWIQDPVVNTLPVNIGNWVLIELPLIDLLNLFGSWFSFVKNERRFYASLQAAG